MNADSQFKSDYSNELLCSLGTVNNDSLAWMSRGVVAAVTTGIRSITFMRDVSSLVPLKKPTIESTSETYPGTSQLAQFSLNRARRWSSLLADTTQYTNTLICPIEDELLLHITNAVMSVLVQQIDEIFHEKLKPGQKLHRELCALYGSVTSQSTSNLQQFVDCIHDLAQALAHSSQLSDDDFENVDPTNLVTDLVSKYLNGSVISTDKGSVNTEITVTAAKIDITNAISKFSDSLDNRMSTFITNLHDFGYIIDDGPMLEAAVKVLTSVCSDIIRSMVQNRICHALMVDVRARTMRSFSSIHKMLSNAKSVFKTTSEFKYSDIVSRYSSRVQEDLFKMRSTTETDARLTFESHNRNIIILDVDKEVIITYSSPENYGTIQLVYNPPCCVFPGGHYDVYEDGEVVQVTGKKILHEYYEDEDEEEDDDLWFSAIATAMNSGSFIDVKRRTRYLYTEHSRRFVDLLASEYYAGQLKHGRALSRLNMNHPTTHIDQPEHEQLDSSHILSCIEQALRSNSMSRLAKVLAKCESESESAEGSSSGQEAEVMTSPVSRGACRATEKKTRAPGQRRHGPPHIEQSRPHGPILC